jgi:uncharacterized protein
MNFMQSFKKAIYLLMVVCFSSASFAGSYEDFFTALERNDPATVTRLLERGFDPNTRDPQGRPALYAALQAESLDAAAALWRHPQLDVNALNSTDESPLMMAALKGQLQWSTRLLERGAVVNKTGWTPLHYAASSPESDTQVLALLLDKGAAINAASPNGSTPIMMAALYGTEAGVRLLLSRGADLKRKNDLGMTVADFADRGGREKLAAQLRTAIAR